MSEYRHIEVSPLTRSLGAEVQGVDLSRQLSDDVFEELHRAFLERLVLFFRDQHMSREQHVAFGKRFGELNVHPFVESVSEEHPEIIPVVKEADDRGGNFGGAWHSDVTFLEQPSLGAILYNKETPPYGGDTLWANMYLAYEALSSGMQQMLSGMRAIHSAQYAYGEASPYVSSTLRSMKIKTGTGLEKGEVLHPVVRTHPETGRKILFVNPAFTVRFENMSRAESEPLLRYLYEHATQPQFTCRFHWEPNSVAFWDNRCTWHNALNDYQGYRRAGERVTVVGDRPQ